MLYQKMLERNYYLFSVDTNYTTAFMIYDVKRPKSNNYCNGVIRPTLDMFIFFKKKKS